MNTKPDKPEPDKPEPKPHDGEPKPEAAPPAEPKPEKPGAETPPDPTKDPGDPRLPGRPKEGDNAHERQAAPRSPSAWRGGVAFAAPPIPNPIGSVAMGSAMTGSGTQGFPTVGAGSGIIFTGLGQSPTAAAFAALQP